MLFINLMNHTIGIIHSSSFVLLLVLALQLQPPLMLTEAYIYSEGEASTSTANNESTYKIAMVPHYINSSYFRDVYEGCYDRSKELGNVECDYIGPQNADDTEGAVQVQFIHEIIEMHLNGTRRYDGFAVSPINETAMSPAINRALEAGISVICFDNDAIESNRQAYVGTDNREFGQQIAKVLLQLRPEGGDYAILSIRQYNVGQRVEGIRETLQGTLWNEIPNSIVFFDDDGVQWGFEQVLELKKDYPNVSSILPPLGMVMMDAEAWKKFVKANPEMTFVVGDATEDYQIPALRKGLVDGLVGQNQYQMGELSVDTLLEIQRMGNPPRDRNNDMIRTTSFSLLLRAPNELPVLVVDQNYLGNLTIFGYILFAIMTTSAWAFIGWNLCYAKTRIVKAAQPIFLVLLAIGVLLMGAAIIPLSIDDQKYSLQANDIACNATPWLFSVGFTIAFSALFSKLYRIRVIVQSSQQFSRVTVTARDVMIPFLVLLALNLIVLICWAILDPLHYERKDNQGTDPWQRVISAYGSCYSSTDSQLYLGLLTAINLCALAFANIQAYRARHIRTEFSESKYIGYSLVIMTEAVLIGVPIILLLQDRPQVRYVVRVMLIFVIGMSTLCCIFLPKVFKPKYQRNESNLSQQAEAF